MIQTATDMKTYKQKIQESLENHFLQKSLRNFGEAYPTARKKAFEGIDFERLRDDIAKGKDEVLPKLDELFHQFKENAEKKGVKVHFAQNARHANEIIASIAKENHVKNIVKSKSMTAEETFLNDHLEADGYHVTETDLGEWIIQLRHEGPSHMVMPAIHLSRQEVAELFTRVTGETQEPDNIDKMVKVARKSLRQAFLDADMGISGANFAIAETGTIGIISNEGNARLTTTLPKVHVALIGLDKLVPNLKSALRILKALPRNATGQMISSYVTWITGAVECDSTADKRKICHFVFLDNGRSALAKDPIFNEALRCIRCGACANVCPVYQLVGGHKMGHVYIGAIGLILTAFYHGRENARMVVRNCINCQACKAVCAAGIDLPFLIKKAYQLVLEDEKIKPPKNLLLSAVMKNRRLFHTMLKGASLAQQPLIGQDGFIRHLPQFFERNHGFRSLPPIVEVPFRSRFKSIKKTISNPKYRVAFFGGCAMDFIYPEHGEAFIRLMNKFQVQVDYPKNQTCCGLPALMSAEEETAAEVALQNIEAIDPQKYDFIVTLCASCGSHITENYPKILKDHSTVSEKLKEFNHKVMDFSSFMINVLKVNPLEFSKNVTKTAYHAPCHLCRGMKVTEAPRKLIETAGYEYVQADGEEVCCGFGGSYSVDFPEISSRILDKKLTNVEKTGANRLVTDCPGCVLQLKGGMHRRGGNIRVSHIAEAVCDQMLKD